MAGGEKVRMGWGGRSETEETVIKVEEGERQGIYIMRTWQAIIKSLAFM